MNENKDLLLKYLSMALPYGVQVLADIDKTFDGGIIGKVTAINLESKLVYLKGVLTPICFEEIKPYLRTLSSMTEEEFVYFMGIRGMMLSSYKIQSMMKEAFNNPQSIGISTTLGIYFNKINWLLKNHFDFMGLTPENLAIEITESNNPYKA